MLTLCLLAGGGCASLLGFDEPHPATDGDGGVVPEDADAGDGDATPVPDARPEGDAASDPQGVSCKAVLDRLTGSPSGLYTIDPDEDGPIAPFVVYCDMVSLGGGWTLVLAYSHHAGTNPPLHPGEPPQDPSTGFGHFSSAQLRAYPFDAVHFACLTDAHTRFMDFRTADVSAVGYVKGTTSNRLSAWTGGIMTDGNHNAFLPMAATAVHNCPEPGVCGLQDRLTSDPFFSDEFHWAIGENGAWECDDKAIDGSNETLHQVWVR